MMFISRPILATILSLSLFSGSAAAQQDPIEYCNYIGSFAALAASQVGLGLGNHELEEAATFIATETSYDYRITKSKIIEIAIDPKRKRLTPSEYAGFNFFWCVYDAEEVQFGAHEVFQIQTGAIEQYRATLGK